MKTFGLPFALGLVGSTFAASLASAHVRLVAPTPRYPTPSGRDTGVDIKDGPCGRMNGTRTTDMNRITVFQPGQTIMVQFNETINHTGWFRIAFDNDGQDAFAMPPLSRTAVQMGPTFTLPVLLDNIADGPAGMRTVQVTLPNVECENCTLQLIQVMDVPATDQTWLADDIYYTCADIVLRRTGGGGMGGMGGGGAGMPSGGAGGMPATGGADAGGFGGAGGTGVDMGGLGGTATGGTAGAATGGAVGTGGVATGGVSAGGAPAGGAAATGGNPTGSGGTSAAGAPTSGTTSSGAATPPETAEDSGCHLAPGRTAGSSWPLALFALAAFGAIRRRRESRSVAV
jgi:MYXO-CTERM domain-containing protein